MRILIVMFFVTVGALCYGAPVQTDQRELVLAKEEVHTVIKNTINILANEYLFEQRTPELINELKVSLERGHYDRHYKFGRLKQHLDVMLYRGSGDSNFELVQRAGFESPFAMLDNATTGSIESGVHNSTVGYIALNGDIDFASAHAELRRAIEAIADVQAVIIDLREVGLGSLPITQQLLSYFFAPGTALADIHFPKGNTQHLLSEVPQGSEVFSTDVPLYVVNSAFVTGPWELFGYTLKHYDRATIIGEKTMGVAVMIDSLPVSENVRLRLSRAYLAHPVSNDNWQDWGVEADYEATAARSFTLALRLAEQKATGNNSIR